MFSTTVRRLAEAAKSPPTKILNVYNNPYKSRKVWPPNFQKLTPQQQLRFEKKYKRRIYLASHSPKWDKGARLLQFAMISGALVYVFFFAEFEWWGQKYKPSEQIVRKAANLFGVMDPETRYERRKDAPPVNPKKEEVVSK